MDKRNLIVDGIALVVYLVAANPVVTGIGFHEWISLGLFVAFFVHVVLHIDWTLDTLRAAFSRPSFARVGNLVLDVLSLVSLTVVVVSGLLISGSVLPTFGFYADGYYFWDPLHSISAKVLLALLLVHVVVHWKWLASFIKKGKGGEHGD